MGHGGLDGPIFEDGGQIGLDWPSPQYLPLPPLSNAPSLARQTRFRDRFFDFNVNEPMQKICFDGMRP